jgi:hypothetical protein
MGVLQQTVEDELKDIHIVNVDADFEREPLIRPFGFKGGALSELWQVASYLESDSGQHGIGLSTQSVLWSDAKIFSSHSESGGKRVVAAKWISGLHAQAAPTANRLFFKNSLRVFILDIVFIS